MRTVFTIAEATKRTPFSERQLRAMIERRQIEPSPVGRRLYLPEAELREKLGPLFRSA